MSNVFDEPEDVLATTARLLEAEGMRQAAELLRSADARFEQTGYDNWNGGTNIYLLYLRVPPEQYGALGTSRESIEQQIAERLKPIIEQYSEHWFSVRIAPLVRRDPEWRAKAGGITRSTRSNIFDALRLSKVIWSGALGEVEFLERIFDLKSMPSTDGRFSDAAGDIWQHRVNNPEDWSDDWIFADRRFNLLDGPEETFLKFLCETVHPVVRPDRSETATLVQHYNEQLRLNGWELAEEEPIAGRPRYGARRSQPAGARAATRARTVADALDAGWMQKEIKRLEGAVETDPSLAIGTAKDLVESCCKTILGKRGVEIPKGVDLPKLVKMVAKELKLVPEGISEAARGAETIRIILSNLTALTQGLAELRGLYGSGHGRDGRYRGLEPRHARLAVGAAVAFIDFITETYHDRVTRDLTTPPGVPAQLIKG
jgi:HEPN domain-containing protein